MEPSESIVIAKIPASTNRNWIVAALERWLALLLLAISLAGNVYLGWVVRQYSGPAKSAVRLGTEIPPLIAEQVDGSNVVIEWKSDVRPTVLYVFTPSCIWCKRNLENIKALSSATGSRYRFIGISLSKDGLQEFAGNNSFLFPVYSVSSKETAQKFKFRTTPMTIVISTNGRILNVWSGAYGGRVQKDVESTFQVRLPGLPSAGESPLVAP